METSLWSHDARGTLEAEELEPGHLWIRVQGHLTSHLGEEFLPFAQEVIARSPQTVVYLDARELRGFDPDVREQWLDLVLDSRRGLDRIVCATRGVFVSLSARTASLVLEAVGVTLEVINSESEFDQLVARRGAQVLSAA